MRKAKRPHTRGVHHVRSSRAAQSWFWLYWPSPAALRGCRRGADHASFHPPRSLRPFFAEQAVLQFRPVRDPCEQARVPNLSPVSCLPWWHAQDILYSCGSSRWPASKQLATWQSAPGKGRVCSSIRLGQPRLAQQLPTLPRTCLVKTCPPVTKTCCVMHPLDLQAWPRQTTHTK